MEQTLKTIAFDVHGTLYDHMGKPRTQVIEFLKVLKKAGHTIIVWSTETRAEVWMVITDLDLEEYVDMHGSKLDVGKSWLPDMPDIAFDDQAMLGLAIEATIKV